MAESNNERGQGPNSTGAQARGNGSGEPSRVGVSTRSSAYLTDMDANDVIGGNSRRQSGTIAAAADLQAVSGGVSLPNQDMGAPSQHGQALRGQSEQQLDRGIGSLASEAEQNAIDDDVAGAVSEAYTRGQQSGQGQASRFPPGLVEELVATVMQQLGAAGRARGRPRAPRGGSQSRGRGRGTNSMAAGARLRPLVLSSRDGSAAADSEGRPNALHESEEDHAEAVADADRQPQHREQRTTGWQLGEEGDAFQTASQNRENVAAAARGNWIPAHAGSEPRLQEPREPEPDRLDGAEQALAAALDRARQRARTGTSQGRDGAASTRGAGPVSARARPRVTFQGLCAREGMGSELGDYPAWDRVRRSLLFETFHQKEKETIRTAEAILIWAGANIEEPEKWERLPDHLLATMSQLMKIRRSWSGQGERPSDLSERIRAHFVSISDCEGSVEPWFSSMAKSYDRPLQLTQVRPTDMCRFLIDCDENGEEYEYHSGDDEGDGDGGQYPSPAWLPWIGSGRELEGDLRLRRARLAQGLDVRYEPLIKLPPPWVKPRPRSTGVTALSTIMARRAAMQASQPSAEAVPPVIVIAEKTQPSLLEIASATALEAGSQKDQATRKVKSRKRSRRTSESGSDTNDDGPAVADPEAQLRIDLRNLVTSWGGTLAMTDELRLKLPILTQSVFLISPDIIRIYLSAARWAATNLRASLSTAQLALRMQAQNKLIRNELKGVVGPDRRDPYEVEPCLPWQITLKGYGPQPDALRAAIDWGNFLLLACRWKIAGTEDFSSPSILFQQARIQWVGFEQSLLRPDTSVSSKMVTFFRTIVKSLFEERMASARLELTRLPSVLRAMEDQIVDLEPWLAGIAIKASGNNMLGTGVALHGFMGLEALAPLPAFECTIWRLVLRPIMTNIMNTEATASSPVAPAPSCFGAHLFGPPLFQPQSTTALFSASSTTVMVEPGTGGFALPPPQYTPPLTTTVVMPLPPASGGQGQGGASRGFSNFDQRFDQFGSGRFERSSSGRGTDSPRSRQGSTGTHLFGPRVYRPMSPALVGTKLARLVPPPSDFACRRCAAGTHKNGPHRSYECPLAYIENFQEPPPGYDADGRIVDAAWTANKTNITENTKRKWVEYIARHRLQACMAEIDLGPNGGVDFVAERQGGMVEQPATPRSRAGRGGRQ